jgi:hypothetical protein
VLSAVGLLAAAATLRLGLLYWQVRRSDPGQLVTGLSGALYLRTVLRVWSTLYAVSIPMFLVQENFERWNAGLGLPGLGVLGAIGLDGPVLLFALVSLAFALVVALYRLGVDRLEALIAEAQTRARRPVPAALLPARSDPESAPSSVIGRNLAGRAPPALSFA